MPSEFAPPGGRPRVTKKQIQKMQENYKKAGELLEDSTEAELQEKAILDELFEEEFENAFSDTQKIGVYIGRFQPFHKGHENVVRQILQENDKVLIFIGTGGDYETNPYSFSQCISFFEPYASEQCIVQDHPDEETDAGWVKNLVTKIEKHTVENSIWNFYGGDLQNDYAITALKENLSDSADGLIHYIEIPRDVFLIKIQGEDVALTGTQCRQAVSKGDINFLGDALPEHVFHILFKKY